MTEKITEAIKKLRESSKKRKFDQTFDMIINLKELDVKKEGKINEEVVLPHGSGSESKVAIFSDSIKSVDGSEVYNSSDVNEIVNNKRLGKRLAKDTEFFLAEPKLMSVVGKAMGQTLAPKGKMPKIFTGDPKAMVQNLRKSIRVKIKDSPVIQCVVGKESMDDKQLTENINAVLKHLEAKLPKGRANIGVVLLKMSMSKPLKLEL